ncbi:hypothetical protein SAY86_009296 [Trapa natans]|uniref:Uncharacterized protein n=1 Tax=Trapa natans TaxID=22666 RepID=A0AAN7QR28_TRANT|nr:hypothetical protein SAY86_009296 [Trapa natans]
MRREESGSFLLLSEHTLARSFLLEFDLSDPKLWKKARIKGKAQKRGRLCRRVQYTNDLRIVRQFSWDSFALICTDDEASEEERRTLSSSFSLSSPAEILCNGSIKEEEKKKKIVMEKIA